MVLESGSLALQVGCSPGGADEEVDSGHERGNGRRRYERVAREAFPDVSAQQQPYARPEPAAEARVGVRAGVLERVGEHHDGGVGGYNGIRVDPRAEEVAAVEEAQQSTSAFSTRTSAS